MKGLLGGHRQPSGWLLPSRGTSRAVFSGQPSSGEACLGGGGGPVRQGSLSLRHTCPAGAAEGCCTFGMVKLWAAKGTGWALWT